MAEREIDRLERGDGRVSLWCKAPPDSQAVLVGAYPRRFFVPPYVGAKGWVGMRLDDRPDWAEVAALVRRSYRLIAPKRLADRVEGPPGPLTSHPKFVICSPSPKGPSRRPVI